MNMIIDIVSLYRRLQLSSVDHRHQFPQRRKSDFCVPIVQLFD